MTRRELINEWARRNPRAEVEIVDYRLDSGLMLIICARPVGKWARRLQRFINSNGVRGQHVARKPAHRGRRAR